MNLRNNAEADPFRGDSWGMWVWRGFTVPWAPDERVERIKGLTDGEARRLLGAIPEVFPRIHGSPFYMTKIPDLNVIRYSRYIDATGTHRLRGPEDIARYAALVTGSDRMQFGHHQIATTNSVASATAFLMKCSSPWRPI